MQEHISVTQDTEQNYYRDLYSRNSPFYVILTMELNIRRCDIYDKSNYSSNIKRTKTACSDGPS